MVCLFLIYGMLKKTILSLAFLFFFLASNAQYTQVGNGGFASFFYGPMATIDSTPYFNRHAYIYPAASIPGLEHGDTIRSIEFMRNGSDTLAGTASFKIYLKNSQRADFGSGVLNWKAEVRDSGMSLVFDDHPKEYMGSTAGLVRFDFDAGDFYLFDTSGGADNLQVLVEYTQQTNQVNPIAWFNESSFSVPAFVSNNETKLLSGGGANWNDSLSTGSSQIKPTIRFNHPRHAVNMEVRNIYSLGRVPLRMKTADTIKAIVENIGLDTIYNHKVYLEVSGVNQYIDSITLSSLEPYEQSLVRFNNYVPVNQGREVLSVRIAEDGDTSDNISIKDRLVNYNIYTHADPFQGNAGGIGFNGSTGDFVAKFFVNDSDYINQIKVDFSNSGRSFQLGVWEDDPITGLPSTNIYTSDTLISTAGTFILEVNPKIQVQGGFFVGIRQTSNTNVAFSYQPEVPVRPDVFFFAAPLGDTNWVPFSPGFNFNFNIQPRIQVGNDLAIVQMINPMDGADIEYSETDSLIPEVRVANYGVLDQNNAQVEFVIQNKFGQTIYSDSRIISLEADSQMMVQFDPFSLYNLGEFIAEASVDLNIDSVKDNNSLQASFILYKDHDVAADIIFEPGSGDSFEINQDGFWPQVRVYNYGRQAQSNFPVTARLRKDDNTLDSQVLVISLNGEESTIIVFDSIFPSEDGWLDFEAYTELGRDSFPENDTVRTMVYGKKSNDIAALRIIKPLTGAKYATNTVLAPFFEFRNIGLLAQDSILLTAQISDVTSSVIYEDSLWSSLNFFSTAQAIFKDFQLPVNPSRLKCFMEVWIEGDQKESNDTLSVFFDVVNGRDLQILSIDSPFFNETIAIGSPNRSVKFSLYNNGLVNAENFGIELELNSIEHGLVLKDTLNVSEILVGESLNLEIGDLSFAVGGNYTITLRNLWSQEAELSANDSAESTYIVRFGKDVSIDSLLNPNNQESVQIYSVHYPQISVSNQGLDSLAAEWKIEIRNPQNDIVFADTLEQAKMESGAKQNLSSFKAFEAMSLGIYTSTAHSLGTDDNVDNDSIMQNFSVIKSVDISVDSAILPFPGEALLTKANHEPMLFVSNKGLEDVDANWTLFCEVWVNGNMIYSDQLDTSLEMSQVMSIVFDSSLRFPDPANATVTFWTEHPQDVEQQNDTLRNNFVFSDKLSDQMLEAFGFRVYPNPFEKELTIDSDKIIEKIEILNAEGRLVKRVLSSQRSVTAELDVPAGVYYLKIFSDQQTVTTTVLKLK